MASHKKQQPNEQGFRELLYQAYETELGGEKVYTAALKCVKNTDLEKEWNEYLEQTKGHQEALEEVFSSLGMNLDERTPGREIVAHHGASLVAAIELAAKSGDAALAEIVAAECVVLAETKDHQNWELLASVAEHAEGDLKKVLQNAVSAVETQEDHHLYHTMGWARELWIDTLGYPAVLPPPEERKHVESAIGAARAEQAREKMIPRRH
jgi:rubrerythrin